MVAPIRYLSRRVQEEKIGILQSTENKKVLEVVGRVGIGTTIFDPGYQLDVRGDVNIRDSLTVDSITITGAGNSFSGITTFVDTTNNVLGDPDTGAVQIDGGLGVNKNVTVGAGLSVAETAYIVGVSTFRDRVIFDSINSIQIPSGTEGEKDAVGVAVTGQIRFNTTNQQFEGFGVGNNWGSLGGVKDVDGDTEIKAELSAGSDEDTLYFYTGGYLSGTISSTTGADLNVDLNVDGHIETDTLNVSGLSTFGSNVDVNASVDILNNLTVDGFSDLDELNVAGIATFGSDLDVNASVDISTNLTVDGFSDLDELNVSGLSTFGSNVDINASVDISTNLTVDGFSDLDELNVSGLSTFGSNVDVNASVDISNNLVVDGLSDLDELNVAGLSTFTLLVDANGGIDASSVKVEDLTDNRVVIAGTGGELEDDANFTFDGSQLVVGAALTVTGVSTFASDVDVNASVDISTNLTVDGLSDLDELNVAGISSFSSNVFVSGKLGVGTDVTPTGKFEVAGGDAVFRENVDIYQNLFVAGTISVAGTSVILDSETVRIEDKDLVLGFTTTITPNDTTANHGGIAIASTEGYPLVPLYVAGINTLPDTYKQIMWVKSGTYAGMTTDAWVSNYAISIGNTSIEEGVTLKVGTATTAEDQIRMYGNTGIISASRYYGSGGFLDDIINQKVEGITAKLVDNVGTSSTLGNPLRVTDLIIDNSNASSGYITAVGFGSTAIYYFNDPIAKGLTTDASINTTGIVTFQSDVNVGLGATLTLFDISTGRIGINSIIPENTLDVIGDVKLAGKLYDHTVSAGSTDYVITSNGDASEWEWKAISSLSVAANVDVQEIGASDTRYLSAVTATGLTTEFFIDTNNPVVINGSGNLGVGTDSPQATLHVVDEFLLTTAGAASSQRITQRAYTTDNGTLSWEGSAGQLFSVTNNLTSGSIFSVNDVSGIPSIDVDADGTIQLAPFGASEYVGIGLTNPTQKLDVNGDARLRGALYDFNNATGNPGELLTTTGAGVSWSTATATPSGRSVTSIASSTPYYITASETNSGVSTAAYIDSNIVIKDGNLGIGTDNPTAKLDVNGGVIVSGVVTATDFNSTSDARLKTNVQVIEDPLEKVLQINGVSFNWIKDNRPSMGVIADNIQEVLPELVSDTDPKTVNYNGLIGLLIECVKHQQAEINALKASINNNN